MPDSSLIQAARNLRELIESEADEIEATCSLTKPVVDAIEKTGLFLLSTPKQVGGLEADVDTIIASASLSTRQATSSSRSTREFLAPRQRAG